MIAHKRNEEGCLNNTQKKNAEENKIYTKQNCTKSRWASHRKESGLREKGFKKNQKKEKSKGRSI